MTLEKFNEVVDGLTEEEHTILRPVLEALSAPSKHIIRMFQDTWNGPSYEEFCKEQNGIIKALVKTELGESGVKFRAVCGMGPLDLDALFTLPVKEVV